MVLRKLFTTLALGTLLLTSLSAEAEKFRGNIGNYQIVANINIMHNGKCGGAYQYVKNGKPNSSVLKLSGTWQLMNTKGSHELMMIEKTPAGKVSGKWKVVYESRGGNIHGYFTNSKGEQFKVNLMEDY